jgi:hypothetical protein
VSFFTHCGEGRDFFMRVRDVGKVMRQSNQYDRGFCLIFVSYLIVGILFADNANRIAILTDVRSKSWITNNAR